MKFYFEGKFDKTPIEAGKLAKVSITPDTNNRSCREVFVLVAKEISEVVSGEEYSLGLVGKNKTPMIFPNPKPDTRILVMGDIPQPKHRYDGFIDIEKTTAEIVDQSSGGGAWGAGSCFLAILKEGERVVSNRLTVWENKGGVLVKTSFDSLAEYELQYDVDPDIQLI